MNAQLSKILGPIALLLALAGLAWGLLKPASSDASTVLEGKAAPDFKLKSLDGGTISLSSFQGRPVVINFFASWCLPCADEAPMLRQSALEPSNKDVVFLGIAYSDKADDTRKFRDKYSLGFPILIDSDDSRASVQYAIKGVPETFFIARDGTITRFHAGPLSQNDLTEGLKKIL